MTQHACLYNDSNQRPALRFLPSTSRHKETEQRGLPRRQEGQPVRVPTRPRSARTGITQPGPAAKGTASCAWRTVERSLEDAFPVTNGDLRMTVMSVCKCHPELRILTPHRPL